MALEILLIDFEYMKIYFCPRSRCGFNTAPENTVPCCGDVDHFIHLTRPGIFANQPPPLRS
jgi:hypothetical protein